jgi:hypothetical protein
MTEDEGKQIADQNGLEPGAFSTLVEAWGRPPSHEQMMTLYHRGQATLDQVRQAIRESNVKNKYIDQIIDLGRELIPQRTIVAMINHGVITHDKGIELLLLHGYTREDADSLVKLGTSERAQTHKTLSRADLVLMYTDRLLTRVEARDHLMKLGYSETDANAMLDLADVKAKTAALKVLQKGVQATLRAHHATPDEAIKRLIAGGMDERAARELVDLWTLERTTASRNLSESQITKATEFGLFTVPEGLARLQALGLTEPDATIVFQLAGLIPGVTVPPTPAP